MTTTGVARLLLAASVVAGCGSTGTDPGGGPTKPLPQISFVTADMSTGARAATVQIYGGLDDVPDDLISTVASKIRVATWPADGEVATTEVITNIPHAVLPNGAVQAASAKIEKQLDANLDASVWYAIAVAAQPATYSLPGDAASIAFDGGARGVRFSPAHPPVVASVMSCAKDGGVVAVYVRYSEPVVRAAGAMPILDYGVPPAGCMIGGDSPAETQFICANAGSGDQPFWLEIPDGVTAQGSGAAMAPVRFDVTGTQATTTSDGCTLHKPSSAS